MTRNRDINGKRKRIWAAFGLLLPFLFYFAGTNLCFHIHQFGDTKLVHSHPYAGDKQNPAHKHSPRQFQTISLLSAFVTDSHIAENGIRPMVFCQEIPSFYQFSFSSIVTRRAPGRDPPFSLL